MAKDIGKDAKVFHLSQLVLHHDTDAEQGGVLPLLVRGEGMMSAPFAREGHAALQLVVLQPLDAVIGHQRKMKGDLLQGSTLPQQSQIVACPRHRAADVAQPPGFVDNEQCLTRVRLLARVVRPLRRCICGALHPLFGGVNDSQALLFWVRRGDRLPRTGPRGSLVLYRVQRRLCLFWPAERLLSPVTQEAQQRLGIMDILSCRIAYRHLLIGWHWDTGFCLVLGSVFKVRGREYPNSYDGQPWQDVL